MQQARKRDRSDLTGNGGWPMVQVPQRPADEIELAITFQYYRDLPGAAAFYEDVLGFDLAIDQG